MDISGPNVLFPVILEGKENQEVLNEALEIQVLGDEVIERLTKLKEFRPEVHWWEDKSLIDLFMNLYRSGCILLPRDGVDRLRWIALICFTFSQIYDFKCGTVVTALDFLPKYLVELFGEEYPAGMAESVLGIRKQISENGWEKVFEA